MNKPPSLRDQIKDKCVHFTGIPHCDRDANKCEAGVNYHALMRVDELGRNGCALRIPCTGSTGITRGEAIEPCEKYQVPTEEEIQAKLDEHQRLIDCLMNHVSQCCGAEINESEVIQDGPHKGHGPRYCSECGKCVFMV